MKKVIIVLSVTLAVVIIYACCDTKTYKVQITSVDFKTDQSIIEVDDIFEFRLLPQDSVLYVVQNLNIDFINSAYAFDCSEDIYEPIEIIVKILVKSDADFSNEYSSGSDLGNFIKVKFFNWRSEKIEVHSLSEFMNYVLDDDRPTANIAEIYNATFQIIDRPSISSKHHFTFTFILSDESELITESELIEWK